MDHSRVHSETGGVQRGQAGKEGPVSQFLGLPVDTDEEP